MLFQRKALQVLSGGMGYAFGRKSCISDGGGKKPSLRHCICWGTHSGSLGLVLDLTSPKPL